MKNFIIKLLGGYTEAEYNTQQRTLLKFGRNVIWSINNQPEKTRGMAQRFFKAAGMDGGCAKLKAEEVYKDTVRGRYGSN